MELYQALITLDGWTFLAQICNLMIQLLILDRKSTRLNSSHRT